jgi:hypothetical protein
MKHDSLIEPLTQTLSPQALRGEGFLRGLLATVAQGERGSFSAAI